MVVWIKFQLCKKKGKFEVKWYDFICIFKIILYSIVSYTRTTCCHNYVSRRLCIEYHSQLVVHRASYFNRYTLFGAVPMWYIALAACHPYSCVRNHWIFIYCVYLFIFSKIESELNQKMFWLDQTHTHTHILKHIIWLAAFTLISNRLYL